jgi:hypothetical protein
MEPQFKPEPKDGEKGELLQTNYEVDLDSSYGDANNAILNLGSSRYSIPGHMCLKMGKRVDAIKFFLLSTDNLSLDVANTMNLTKDEFLEGVENAIEFIKKMPDEYSNQEMFQMFLTKMKEDEYYEAIERYKLNKASTIQHISATKDYFLKEYKFS